MSKKIIFLVVFLTFILSPLFFSNFPPLMDFPNHLARTHILVNLDQDSFLNQFFNANFSLKPNLGMDIVCYPLIKFFPTILAGKVFVALCIFLLLGSMSSLHYTLFKKVSILPLILGGTIVYSRIFHMGFMSYTLGLSFFIFGVSFWLRYQNDKFLKRLLIFLSISSTLFLIHLVTLGLYFIVISAIEIQKLYSSYSQKRPLSNNYSSFILITFQVICSLTWYYLSDLSLKSNKGLVPQLADGVSVEALIGKFTYLVFSLYSFHKFADISILLSIVLLISFSIYFRKLKLHNLMIVPLACLFLCYMIMPMSIGLTTFVYTRLPISLLLIGLSSVDLSSTNFKFNRLIILSLSILLIIKVLSTTSGWHSIGKQIEEVRSSFKNIPKGSKVLATFNTRVGFGDVKSSTSRVHIISLGVIERSFYFPTLFTDRRISTVHVKKELESTDSKTGHYATINELVDDSRKESLTGHLSYLKNWETKFDYIYVIGKKIKNQIPNILSLQTKGEIFHLYKIKP